MASADFERKIPKMTTKEPLVHFYDLSGPRPWSHACWRTRYALNYKGIPYVTIRLSYPEIKPKCEELFTDMTGLEATVPIVEILGPNYKALNDSAPIARLLNERFHEKNGYKDLREVEAAVQYEKECNDRFLRRGLYRWIVNDVYHNALDSDDGSKEYFKTTREEKLKTPLKDVIEVMGGGEAKVLEEIKGGWKQLRERMKNEDGTGEPNYIDFYDASLMMWVKAASEEKYDKLMKLYGDDTLTKLMNKVEPYSSME